MAILCGVVARAADGHPFTLYFPTDDRTINDLKRAASDGGIGGDDVKGILAKTKLYSKGTKLGPMALGISSFSDKQDMPIYSRDYYCTPLDNKITTTKPGAGTLYIRYTLGVGLYGSNSWSGIVPDRVYPTRVGVIGNTNVGTLHIPAKLDSDTSSGDYNGYPAADLPLYGVGGDNDIRDYAVLANDDKSNEGDADPIKQADDYDVRFNALVHHRGVNATLQSCLPPHSGDTGFFTSNYSKLSKADQDDWKDKLKRAGITLGATSSGGGGTTTGGDDSEAVDDVKCSGGALGWILCPVIELMASATSTLASFLDGLMNYSLLAKDPTAVQTAWGGLLSIGNILLVLAFLAIIFSQSTSLGLSSYGVKRMLPRLLLAAILINVSFYICAFMVDVSNIVGSSISGFLIGSNSIGAAVNAQLGGSAETGTFQNIVGGLAAGAAIVAIIAFLLLPVVLSFLLVVLLLAARLVLLSLLIIISPLAFAAWLLPNTESYFSKWWNLFTKLLFMYPIVMALFAASLMIANLVDSFDLPDLGGAVASIIKLAILAVPLFALPKILMSSNAIMGQVGSLGQKFNAKIQGGAVGKAFAAPRQAAGKSLKSRAAFAGANLSQRLQDSDRWGTGVANWAAGRRRTGMARRQARDFAVEARKHEREQDVRQRMGQTLMGGTALADALKRTGGPRVVARAAAEERERLNEELKRETLKLEAEVLPGDTAELERRLRTALTSGDAVGTRALMARFAQEGKGAIAQMGDVLRESAAGGIFNNSPVMERAVAEQRQADWNAIKAADPALAGLNLTDSTRGAAGSSSISVAPEQLATMAGSRLEQLAGDGTITPDMVGEAASKGMLKGLDSERRDALERGLGGATIEQLRVKHEAAPFRASGGSTGSSGPEVLGPDGRPLR